MTPVEGLRRVEILINDTWTSVQSDQIDIGDKFRMFEPDGTPVADPKGGTEWVALTRATIKVDY